MKEMKIINLITINIYYKLAYSHVNINRINNLFCLLISISTTLLYLFSTYYNKETKINYLNLYCTVTGATSSSVTIFKLIC